MNLSAPANGVQTVGAGGLTLTGNSTTVTENNFGGQFPATTTLTLNGSGVLNLIGANTAAGVTINGNGGLNNAKLVLNPLANGVFGQLTLGGDITVVNNNPNNTPVLGTSTSLNVLDLGGATRKINASGLAMYSLVLSPVLTDGGIEKTGTGVLVLNNAKGTSNYTGVTQVDAGMPQLNANDVIGDLSQVNVAAGAELYLDGPQ